MTETFYNPNKLKTKLDSYTIKELKEFIKIEKDKIKLTQKKGDLINDMVKNYWDYHEIPHKKDRDSKKEEDKEMEEYVENYVKCLFYGYLI